jgi:D-3-phosphoglycerate dehydrogenase
MSSTESDAAPTDGGTDGPQRRVLVTDPLDEAGLQRLRDGGCEVDVHTDLSTEALADVVSEYEALVVRSGTDLTAEVIEAGEHLSVIGRAGVGVDNIDVAAATRAGVLVTNAPSGNTVAVAEHTLGLLLALARNIPGANQSVKAGEWNKTAFLGTELAGRTLGIVGLGRIGREVADRADSLGMDVVAFDPYVGERTASSVGADLLELSALLERADAVSVHVPLTEETHHLLSEAEFARMDDEALLVHPARGGVVDERALAAAVESGELGGAAVDVFEDEPPAADNPLFALEDVIVTPHIGSKTDEAMSRVATTIADHVLTALDGDVPASALNAPHSDDALVQDALELAEMLGRVAGELADGAITGLDVEYRGDVAESDVEPVTAAAAVGLLDPVLDARVNRVSVQGMLEDRDIQVTERRSSAATEFVTMISLTVETDDGETSVAGTLAQDGEPVIVGLDDYRVKVRSPEHMIVFYGRDEPGVIGDVGAKLATHDVNIAGMYNSRESVGGEAIMVVAVDSHVSPELERELYAVENISDVRAANLA